MSGADGITVTHPDRLLFPANGPSADRVLPEHQSLRIGDRVPDGPPDTECWFAVVEVEEGRRLVLHSGHLVHQIAPTRGLEAGNPADTRATLQGHAIRCGDTWSVYW